MIKLVEHLNIDGIDWPTGRPDSVAVWLAGYEARAAIGGGRYDTYHCLDEAGNIVAMMGFEPGMVTITSQTPDRVLMAEMAEFCQTILGKGDIWGSAAVVKRLMGTLWPAGEETPACRQGVLMYYAGKSPLAENENIDFLPENQAIDYRQVYDMLIVGQMSSAVGASFDQWYTDVHRAHRHGLEKLEIALVDGVYAGVGAISLVGKDKGELHSVFTLPAYRGKKIGAGITTRLTNRLVNEGRQAFLMASNGDSQRLYERLGYVAEGSWAEFYHG